MPEQNAKKLSIQKIDTLDQSSGSKEFTAMINPEQFSLNYSISFGNENSSGQGSGSGSGAGNGSSGSGNGTGSTAGSQPNFQSYNSTTLNFDLHLDGTGVISDNPEAVDDQLKTLEEVVYTYEGDKHRPPYVLISWGSLNFRGALKSYKVDYTLFDPEGKTLRAKVSLSFMEVEDQETLEEMANKSSPDLTHIKTIRAGDHLPLLSNDIYNSIDYYIQVAEKNGLTNFRNLEIGENIFFPPLEK